MDITILSSDHESASLLLETHEIFKYVWIGSNDDSTFCYEGDSLEDLKEQCDFDGWGVEEEFNLEWLMKRVPLTEVDCDSDYGEALFIENKLVAVSPALTLNSLASISIRDSI